MSFSFTLLILGILAKIWVQNTRLKMGTTHTYVHSTKHNKIGISLSSKELWILGAKLKFVHNMVYKNVVNYRVINKHNCMESFFGNWYLFCCSKEFCMEHKVHQYAHNRTPMDPIKSHFNPVHTFIIQISVKMYKYTECI